MLGVLIPSLDHNTRWRLLKQDISPKEQDVRYLFFFKKINFQNGRRDVECDKGVLISHVGHAMLHSPKYTFTLSNVFHVPHIIKPLLSVQNFHRDNNVYFEFHASVFYVKDLTTKSVLLSGQSNDGLYVLSESSATAIPQARSPCVSVTVDIWHRRLSHPTSLIFHLLVFKNKIMCTSRRSLVQCQACSLGKSSVCLCDKS